MATVIVRPPTQNLLPTLLKALQPEPVWALFETLASIPRPSKAEANVLDWLRRFAEDRCLDWQQDALGNMVVRRPGQAGGEAAPTVVIQGHVDMVCEQNAGVGHDFNTQGIKLRRDGDWVKACGTTLGADNGLGVCTALALLDAPSSLKLPPLECLFTVDEEQGLTGAAGLDPSLLTGRIMLNLDTEDWGEIFIGCAGGGDMTIDLVTEQEGIAKGVNAKQSVFKGLLGGHSGINIAEGRGNALVFAAQAAQKLLESFPEARILTLFGGDKRNAICREATLRFLIPASEDVAATAVMAELHEGWKAQYGLLEKGLAVDVEDYAVGDDQLQCMTVASAQKLVSLLLLMPHGAWKMSHAVEGLVETSNNLARVHPEARQVNGSSVQVYKVLTSTRSSITAGLEGLRDRIQLLAHAVGASCVREGAYAGWAPNPHSRIVQLTKKVFTEVLGREPEVKAIHAGLECGILGDKIPGMDCVSYGPTIKGAHSPDEAVLVPTVEPFWKATVALLQRIADGEY